MSALKLERWGGKSPVNLYRLGNMANAEIHYPQDTMLASLARSAGFTIEVKRRAPTCIELHIPPGVHKKKRDAFLQTVDLAMRDPGLS